MMQTDNRRWASELPIDFRLFLASVFTSNSGLGISMPHRLKQLKETQERGNCLRRFC